MPAEGGGRVGEGSFWCFIPTLKGKEGTQILFKDRRCSGGGGRGGGGRGERGGRR